MPNLMIIDDEPLIRSGLSRMIKRVSPDWTITAEANDGIEAMDMISTVKADLIISDIKMPRMDGIQFMRALSEGGYNTPLILLTGYGEFDYAREALRYSAFDYLLKPIHENQVRQVLYRFIQEKFIPVGMNLDNLAQSQLEKLEFDLSNALDNLDKQKVSELLSDQHLTLSSQFSATLVLNQVIRIINTFLTKKGMVGLDYLPKISPEQIPVQLRTIAQSTHDLLDQIEQRITPESDRIIEKAQLYMKENLGKQLTLTEVANYVHFNPTYFSEYFRNKTGETFSHYLMRLRIEEAMVRLRNPDNKINEIADQLGYQDARYFSKMFKLIVGRTPKDYRADSINQG